MIYKINFGIPKLLVVDLLLNKQLINCNLITTVIIITITLTQATAATTTLHGPTNYSQNYQSIDDDLRYLLSKCHMNKEDFDDCIKDVFNDLRTYFPTGLPAYNIRPFDPHHAARVEIHRGSRQGIGAFQLILRNVSEYGWSRSVVTKYRTDFDNKRIIYSQYFPEKSLEGYYDVSGHFLNNPITRNGVWNMTLYDYSQTTSVQRLGETGALLNVHVEADRLGGLKMHISDFIVEGRSRLDNLSDSIINMMWPIGFPIIKPIINELVSRAFTDIFNESFRYFPVEKFLR